MTRVLVKFVYTFFKNQHFTAQCSIYSLTEVEGTLEGQLRKNRWVRHSIVIIAVPIFIL